MEQLRGRSGLSGAGNLEHGTGVKQPKWYSPRATAAARQERWAPAARKTARRRAGEIATALGVHIKYGAQLAGLLCAWRSGGAAAAPAARTTGQDRAACRGDRGGDLERRHAPLNRSCDSL